MVSSYFVVKASGGFLQKATTAESLGVSFSLVLVRSVDPLGTGFEKLTMEIENAVKNRCKDLINEAGGTN